MVKAKKAASGNDKGVTNLRGFWNDEIDAALRRYSDFHTDGKSTVARYRLEKENNKAFYKDKYNILYSSTETMRPSLYAKTPKVQATPRHRDRRSQTVVLASMLIESAAQYAMEDIDFDHVMENVVEDYLLPGLAVAWVRYDPQFVSMGEGDDAYEELSSEGLAIDYVHYRDFLSDDIAVWDNKRWIARRVYLLPSAAEKRFGKVKAKRLSYTYVAPESKQSEQTGKQAVVWEIWDREHRRVIWFSTDYPDDVLDVRDDPLHLKDFWPCPRPLRAVHTTDTFIPQSFYSQYRAQAETLDDITFRIRILTKALRVVGVYDASAAALQNVLTGNDNKMVPIANWAQFASTGGIKGAVEWVPIKDVAAVLMELYKQREIAKGEIYEITGFSDIVRGVSKASETLGAQEIKNDWATGRLRSVQKEVQRFCRDLIRIMAEIIVEHFDDTSLAMYAGFEPSEVTPEEQQAAAQYAAAQMQFQQSGGLTLGQQPPQPPPPTARQQEISTFKEVVALLKKEKLRCAMIGIETDSTIMPDEAKERADRMEFVGAAGAFLQQAGPLAMQYPDMRGLLGGILMFAIRSFSASRPLEKEFEEFTKSMEGKPPMPPPGSEGGGSDPAAAQAQVQGEQIKAQSAQQLEQVKQQGEAALQAQDLQMEKYKIDQQEETKRQKQQQDHEFRMRQLELEYAKLEVQKQDQVLDAQVAEVQENRAERQLEHQQNMDLDGAERADRQMVADQQNAAADRKAKAAQKPTAKPKK